MPTWTKPVSLVPGTAENVNDLNQILDDLYARANGGLDEVNVPNLTGAFTSYKTFITTGASLTSAAAGTYVTAPRFLSDIGFTAAGGASAIFWVDGSDFVANLRPVKLRLRLTVVTNAVAPTVNFTAQFAQVTAWNGGSGVAPGIASLGPILTSATVATPGVSTAVTTTGTDIAAPAAGASAIVVATSGAAAAGSVQVLICALQYRLA